MAYTVSGILKLPDGTAAAGVDLRFVALTTFSPLIESAEQTVRTGANGSYSIALETSSYNVFVTYNNNRPFLAGTIVINSNTAPGQDLPKLLGGTYEPTTPEWITQVQSWLTQAQASATSAEASATTATSEANRAKTEADRAKQISGLETVSDAVALCALPLPDVWAPLSDNLRMITGYGRDVLVGSDVVARMVNFSRSTTATYIGKDGALKTAAANEPRFEKDGLLIEGQSANLVPSSEGASFLAGNSALQTITNGITGVLPVVGQRVAFALSAGEINSAIVQFNLNLIGGTTYTYSFFVKQESGTAVPIETVIDFYSPSGQQITASKVVVDYGNGVYRVSCTFTIGGVGSVTAYPRLNKRGVDARTFVVGGCQVEALPFASSYIPTNGAAVTRAADEWNIPNKLNCGPAPAMPMSVAVNFTCMSYVSFNNIFVAGDRQTMIYAGTNKLRIELGGYTSIDITSNPVSYGGTQNKLRATCSDSRIACLLNGVMTESSGGIPIVGKGFDYFGSSKLRNQFGHIRDVRIWRTSLTNDQLKAVA